MNLILERVLNELQRADELGGCDTTAEYFQLMDAVIAECRERRSNALRWKLDDIRESLRRAA